MDPNVSNTSLEKKIRACPLAKFEFWDAMVSADGDYLCNFLDRPDDPGEYGGPGSRPICYSSNHFYCEWYQKFLVKNNEVKK